MELKEKRLQITKEEFAKRRTKVLHYLENLNELPDGSKPASKKIIIHSGKEKTFSNDVHYPFRADSDFYYLTGFTEPDSALVLDAESETPFSLYVRPKDSSREIWDGPRAGLDGAKAYGADKVHEIKDVPSDEGFICVKEFIHSLRSIKSEAEIELMRKSNDIAIQAHRMIHETMTPGIFEYEVEATLNHVFRSQGASGWSYPAIVASGANSCILHYINNSKQIANDDVVLVDAGCEYQYYASDITRVYPASGSFTQQQQDVYDVVLEAQNRAIKSVKPGTSFKDTHEIACATIADGLHNLGYIKDPQNHEELKKYYMHGTGHSLGIDVHDCGVDKLSSKYVPGMVTTIEPGAYIADLGIGVRIENNVLVTKDGHEDLTAALER